MRQEDVVKVKPGDKLVHKSLGAVEFTEECDTMMYLHHGDPTSMFVVHDGELKEVSIALVEKVENSKQ